MNGKRVLGPFVSRELAMTVRGYVEQAERHHGYWVVDGADVPDA
jgi:hypothetical protein